MISSTIFCLPVSEIDDTYVSLSLSNLFFLTVAVAGKHKLPMINVFWTTLE
jgi:hypothetical protein